MKTGQLRYCLYKDIDSESRYKEQQEYHRRRAGAAAFWNPYFTELDYSKEDELFKFIHRHPYKEEF